MSKGMVDALRAMREARVDRNAERAKTEAGIRHAAAEGKAVLEQRVKKVSERMKNKPVKKQKGKK